MQHASVGASAPEGHERMPCMSLALHRWLPCVWQVQELAEMLRGMGQRLNDGERSWEADKRGLEGQLNRTLHSLRESQASADQLRSVTVTHSSVSRLHALLC